MTIFYQVAATGVVSYLCLSMGIMYTWPSSTLVLFSSENTTLNRPMTETEISLLGSLSSISALVSTPFSSYILDTIGRKYCCLIFSLLQVISWLLVSFFYTVEVVLTSVVLSGFCCCATLAVPIYVNEICQDSIRGSMCSGAMVFYGMGMLVSYLMGGYMSYDAMNYACLAITILGVVLLLLLKDSPTYLMSKGREKEAAQAIAFYRGTNVRSKVVEEELQALRTSLNPVLDDDVATPEEEKLNADLKERPKESVWSFLKKSRSTRRALFVLIVLYTTSIFQGLMVVQVYAEPLFAEAIPTMSPTICSVIFAVVMVVAGFIAAYLVETAGRRSLMLYATFGSGICCILLGTQIHLHWGPHWLTACIIYLYGVVYSCGAGTVPFVMSAEIFLPEIRSFASMISVEWSIICGFVVLFLFNPIVTWIGLGPIFYFFSVVCFISTIFCYFCLPETKGLSVEAIQLLFAKPKRRNMTP
ncbi:PREDICTED: facilitated trehalose transporter Tret1-like [Papilio xuthus]|uniref:Facilitated trehalose transporter Tret1-like n=1 Tax=Papilio xuthus TaxID=66420 RepID=A0AAJ7EKJ0_PAPXU|nr:PREDICTED: facilitated trehalose transporter Tret1-like [Papilio xuthus]